jgi:hypothetical protein
MPKWISERQNFRLKGWPKCTTGQSDSKFCHSTEEPLCLGKRDYKVVDVVLLHSVRMIWFSRQTEPQTKWPAARMDEAVRIGSFDGQFCAFHQPPSCDENSVSANGACVVNEKPYCSVGTFDDADCILPNQMTLAREGTGRRRRVWLKWFMIFRSAVLTIGESVYAVTSAKERNITSI